MLSVRIKQLGGAEASPVVPIDLFFDAPPGAPTVPEGHRVVTLFWD